MAYPIKLFDLASEEGKLVFNNFLQNFDNTTKDIFDKLDKKETQKLYHQWKVGEVPEYLISLGINSIQDILKRLPDGDMKWKGSVGIYGRKSGSLIKKEPNILYRIIIHLGDTEIYRLGGDDFNNEPIVLPNGYALLCSPVMIDRVDIKVQKEPIRKNLETKLIGLVPKIRSKEYLRSTIVLDLLLDGLDVPDLKEASVPLDHDFDDGHDSCHNNCKHN